MTGLQPIDLLLQAAQYLERRERESEHGYASLPLPRSEKVRRRRRGRKSVGSRSTHNEMEKHRRAHLKLCLERLRELVGADNTRHTTLSLLTEAKLHIQSLEEVNEQARHQINQLRSQQRHLKRQLELLLGVEMGRTDSTGSTGSSEPSDSDQEEEDVDVEGSDTDWTGGNRSDSDARGVASGDGYFSTGLKRAKLF